MVVVEGGGGGRGGGCVSVKCCSLVAFPFQHACAPLGRICSDNCACCHTAIKAADQAAYHTLSKCTGTGPTSLNTDPISSEQPQEQSDQVLSDRRDSTVENGIRTPNLPLSRWTARHKATGAFSKEELFVGWLLNVPATCYCISWTDLHRQVYVLPH